MSHETIYRSLFVLQARTAYSRKSCFCHLRSKRSMHVAPGRLIRMAIDGGVYERMPSQSRQLTGGG